MVTEPGETTQAAAFFECPINENASDEFEWFSQCTGSPLNWLDIFFDRYVTGPLQDGRLASSPRPHSRSMSPMKRADRMGIGTSGGG